MDSFSILNFWASSSPASTEEKTQKTNDIGADELPPLDEAAAGHQSPGCVVC
ncbi:hypothetical protein CYLTODRAFT_424583 [Cylindrobasidium torrendii FP15055 ss-10]|uniref:Uncharacterized protein n=1 Tax=Cylindrobasidium torrendii FP15055 ss-10 TaxID=1314674 RepID=A0A0D7B4P2_9AGAR|nr:hypothetical protein CYLTODRAFT_424583 [Cylindrobasidium torrendii FP15055 ss-10]